MRFGSAREAERLADELREGGTAVLEGWKRCLVAVPDEATARERAEGLYAGEFDARGGGSAPG